ncbi:MAG: DNA polymerase I [Thermodesulfobacteriota bacterium]
MDKNEIYLIDGSAYLYRAFHAIKGLKTSRGHPTNATFGFTRILLKLLNDKHPEYVGMFFDAKGPTFRHEIYKEYKANRPPMDEDLATQIPDIKEVVRAMNIPIVEKQGMEADDLVGTFARMAVEKGFKVVMVTGDKDFIQLVNQDCIIWDPMKDIIIDVDTVRTEYGLLPDQFVDMLGFAGDSSDNIPGVPGVGPKTAMKLVAEHGSMKGVYENIDSLKSKKKLYENLVAHKEQAFMSRDLAAINRSVEVCGQPDDFQTVPPDFEKMAGLFQAFEFRELAAEYTRSRDSADKEYTLLTDIEEIKALAETLEKAGVFAVDTETTSTDPVRAELVGISVSYEENRAVYIPVGHTGEDKDIQPDKEKVLSILKPVLESESTKKVGQNIKYDYIVLSNCGIRMKGIIFDTMIASHLVNPSTRGHSLDSIAMDLFGYKTLSYKEITGKGKQQKGFEEIKIEDAYEYACEDADLTLMAYEKLSARIEETGLKFLMDNVEMPLLPVLARMEITGIRIDREKLFELSKSFEHELEKIESDIYSAAGEEFNINSSQQLGVILFEKLGLPVVKKTRKTKGYSTDVDVLTTLSKDHELPALLLRYRTLSKLKSTYSDALQELINPKTGRIHTSFNQSVTATGRLSSSNPNLQNIPVRTEEGRKIRETFVPEQGCVLLSADYSQIELRVLAHCAEDAILMDAFRNNEDIHSRTAIEVFEVIPEFVTDDLRRQAKAVNFGIVYGMSAYKLSGDLGISRKMAQMYIDNYFKRYSGVRRFIDETVETARKTREVKTLLGRKRKVEEIDAKNANTRKFAERIAINTPIQGSAADLIKLAMIRMEKELLKAGLKSGMILSVHDEIIFEVPENEIELVSDLAKEVMENVYDLKVPLVVNIGWGKNWTEAH